MSYNNTLNSNINQYYYYQHQQQQQQQQQNMGGGGAQITQYLSRQQPYTNMNYFNPGASASVSTTCCTTTTTTTNSNTSNSTSSSSTIVPTAASQYYGSHLFHNYNITNNNNNSNNMGLFFNPSAASLNPTIQSTARSAIYNNNNNPTAATLAPSSSSGSRPVSDWRDLSPLEDDPLPLHPYYRTNQHSSNNYATTTNNYNNSNHLHHTNNAVNGNNHSQGVYFASNNTLYTHYNHALPNNNNNNMIQHVPYPQQQQQQPQNNLTNNSNRTSQPSNQLLLQHPATNVINNTTTAVGHSRNISTTSNHFYPYSPSDFDPVDVFKSLDNYSNEEYRSAADQRSRNSIPSSSSTISSRVTTTDNTNTTSTVYDGIFLPTEERCHRTTPSPALYQQAQQMIQPPITNYQNYHKDDLLPVVVVAAAAATTTTTTAYPNVNIVDSQAIHHASTTKATTTAKMTATTVTEANQQGTTKPITVHISGISSQPLSYSDILQLIISRGTDVITKYLPCVDFLVLCQQELRKAVEKNQKVPVKQRYSSKQFYAMYLQPLSDRFYQKHYNIMPTDHLKTASEAISKLLAETKKGESLGCDHMKVTFLGGMREGQSWGLRNWLSKYGSALPICNELEMILLALQKLDPSSKLTINLASQIRKETSVTRTRLLEGVPKAYQQFSSAHPFLPFFHRLDAALKGLAEFDPEDDDVVILDDDEQEKLKAAMAASAAAARVPQKTVSKGSNENKLKSNKRTVVEVLEILDDSHAPAANETNTSWKRRATVSTGAESSNNSTGSSEANTNTDVSDGVPTLDSADLATLTENGATKTSCCSKKYPSLKNNQFLIQGGGSLTPTPFPPPFNGTAGVNHRRHSGGVDGSLDELACEDDFSHIFDNDSSCSSKLIEMADQGDWRCGECKIINTSDVDYCLMCERTKAPSTAMSRNRLIDSTLVLY